MPTACNKLYRNTIFKNGLRFNNDVIHEDTEAMPRFWDAAENVMVIDKAFYHYIKHKNSASTSKRFSLRGYHILDSMKEYERLCRRNYHNLLPQFYQYKLYTTYEMYKNLVNCLDSKIYRRQAVKLRCQIFLGILKCAKWREVSRKYDDKEIMLCAVFGVHLFDAILRLKQKFWIYMGIRKK